MSAIGGVAKNAMKATAAAVGVATVAVGKFGMSSVEAGMTFDSSMAQVAATMGKTIDQLKEETVSVEGFEGNLIDYAQKMGATTAFSASQAADALNYMALAGYDAQTSAEMLPNVLNLAAAGGMELAQASDMVTDASSALGLSLDETAVMVDQMAKASSKSNTSVQQLGEAFLTVGGTAKNLRGGTAELSQVLGIMADNGIKGSEAGTHLRNIMLAMNPETDKAVAAWEKLGVKAYDANGQLMPMEVTFSRLSEAMKGMSDQQKTEILSDMFNKTDLSAVNALLDTQASRYQELKEEIYAAWYTTESLTDSMKNNGLSMESLQKNLEGLGMSAEDFKMELDFAEGSVEDFMYGIMECTDASVTEEQIIEALGGDLGTLQKAFDEAGGSAQAMADTQLDNLAGDITLFKSALEGTQIAVSDVLTPSLRKFVQFGSEGLAELTEAFKEGGLGGAMEAFGDILARGLNMIIEMLPKIIDAAVQLLNAFIQGLVDNLPMVLKAAAQIVKSLGEAIMTNLPLIIEAAVQILMFLAQAFTENMPAFIEAAQTILSMLSDAIMQNLPEIGNAAIQIIYSLAIALIQALPDLIPAGVEMILMCVNTLLDNLDLIVNAALQLISALAEGLILALPKLMDEGPVIISKIVMALVANIPQLIACAGQLIVALINGLIQYLPRLILEVPRIIAALVGGIMQGVKQMTSVGHNLVDGLWQGIKNSWGRLVDNFKNLGTNLLNSFKDVLGIHSPSTKFKYFGEMCVAGLEEPLEDMDLGEITDNVNASLSSMQAGIAGANYANSGSFNGSMTSNVQVVLEGDAAGVFRLVKQETRKTAKSLGYNPLMA